MITISVQVHVSVPATLLVMKQMLISPFPPCRLWTPIDGEFDDYIVNPKPSGYQVKNSPFDLKIFNEFHLHAFEHTYVCRTCTYLPKYV